MSEFTTRRLTIDGATLFTESVGEPGAPVLLLIMGAVSSGVWWPEEFCCRLAARGMRVVRYDHRDAGRSTCHRPGEVRSTAERLADDALAVLDAYAGGDMGREGAARGHLVGMSLGGHLALLLALREPARVASLTLIAWEPPSPADPGTRALAPTCVRHLGHPHPGSGRPGATSAHGGHVRPYPLPGPAGWAGRLGEITAPALVIHGTGDPVLPFSQGLALHAALPGSRLLPLPGTGYELRPADWPAIIEAIIDNTVRAEERGGAPQPRQRRLERRVTHPV